MEAMPQAVQSLANLIPLTHFLKAFRRLAIYRGTLTDVQPQLWALTLITMVCLVLMIILLQYKIRKHGRSIKPAPALAAV